MNRPLRADLSPEKRRALLVRLLRNVEEQAHRLTGLIEAERPPTPWPIIEEGAADLAQEFSDFRTELHRYRVQLRSINRKAQS